MSNVSYSWSSPIGGGRPLHLTLGCRSVLFVSLADISHWKRTTTLPAIQTQVCHICSLFLCTSMSPRYVHTEGEEQSCLSLVDPRKIFSELAFSKLVCSRTVVQPGGPTCCSTHFGVVLSIQKVQYVAQPTSEWFCPSRRSTMLLGPLWSDARTLGRTPMIVLLRSKCWP
ncbi:unnamed protein product [Camellia sinensis]